MSNTHRRKPTSFRLEEVEIATPVTPAPITADPVRLPPAPRLRGVPELGRGLRWGSLLLGALGALVSLAVSLFLYDWVLELIARGDVIGWIAAGLFGLAALAFLMIVLREMAGLLRLRRLDQLRHEADSAARQDDKALAVDVARRLKRFYSGRRDMQWGMQRFAEHENEILDAGELLRLAERDLVAPLDPLARAIVAVSAKRVSVVTAVSPGAIVDMLFVAAQNLRMLRRLATLYGARPGALSLLKLARMVLTHIVLTGGLALGDDLIQQVIGHGLTAKLSARLGEGVFNGALTTRIGLAAIDVCRPLPYLETPRPRFRELVAEVAGIRS